MWGTSPFNTEWEVDVREEGKMPRALPKHKRTIWICNVPSESFWILHGFTKQIRLACNIGTVNRAVTPFSLHSQSKYPPLTDTHGFRESIHGPHWPGKTSEWQIAYISSRGWKASLEKRGYVQPVIWFCTIRQQKTAWKSWSLCGVSACRGYFVTALGALNVLRCNPSGSRFLTGTLVCLVRSEKHIQI